MSKQIKRTEIAEEGVLDNLLKPLKQLDEALSASDKKLKDFAATIEKSLNFGEKSKELREFAAAEKDLNTIYEKKKKVQSEQLQLNTAKEKLEQKLKSLRTEEAKEIAAIKVQIAEQNKELRMNAKAVETNTQAYSQFAKETRQAKNESKELGAQLKLLERDGKENTEAYRQLSEQYAQATAKAAQLDKELKEIDKSVGDNFRNVGNYESALAELNKTVAAGGMGYRELRKRIKEYQDIAVKAGRTSPIGKQAIEDAAKLQDELDTLSAQTKALADDGANLKAALQLGEVVAASYQSVMAAQQLLGVESERVLEVMAKIQAVQVVINNLNKIQAATEKASTLAIKAKSIALRAQTFIMGAQTTATTAATVATRALRLAMLALPIMAIIAGITALVSWLSSAGDETERLKEQTDELTESLKEQREELQRKRDFKNQKINIRNNDAILDQQASIIKKEMELDELKAKQPKNLKAIEDAERSLTQQKLNLLLLQQEQEKKQFDEKIKDLKEEYDLIEESNEQITQAIIKRQREGKQVTEEQMQASIENTKEMRKLSNEITIMEEQRLLLNKKQENERLQFNKNATKDILQRNKKETKSHKENLKERQKADLDFLDEDIKDAGEALSQRMIAQEEALNRQFLMRRKNNIETIKDQEEFNKSELDNEIKLIDDLIELRKLYNEDTLDLELQRAELLQEFNDELNDEIVNSTDNTLREVVNSLDKYFQDFTARQQAELAQQERNAAQLYGTLEKYAAEGNLQAEESLAEMLKLQQEAQREQIRIQQRQQRIEQARQVYAIIQSQLDAGKSPSEAIASTGGYMTAIQGLIASLPSFYEGTEDTGKVSKALDSKGGRLAVLHNNERVLTAEQNKALAGIPNPMIPILVNKGLDAAGNTYDLMLLNEMQRTRKAIENIPHTTYEVQKVMGEFASLIARTRKGNNTTTNKYN